MKDKLGDMRYVAFKQVADYIQHDSTGQTSIASFEIGYLGYYSDLYIIDFAGLVTPGLLPWVDAGADETLYHAIGLYSPDYVVIYCQNINQAEVIEESSRYQFKSNFEEQFCLYKKSS